MWLQTIVDTGPGPRFGMRLKPPTLLLGDKFDGLTGLSVVSELDYEITF